MTDDRFYMTGVEPTGARETVATDGTRITLLEIPSEVTMSIVAAIELLQRQRVIATVFGWDDEVTRIDGMITELSTPTAPESGVRSDPDTP